jgi:phosphoribosylanthranilate isomerase
MSKTEVKICGIKDPETLQIAADAGARFAGFVFYPPSPRYLEAAIAAELARALPTGMRSVGLFVDPTVQDLLRVASSVPLDMIQLHGDETPERVNEIAALMNMPVIKAVRLRGPEDVALAHEYEEVADWLLFDSKIDHDLPDEHGHFGPYGGRYVAETLMPLILEVEKAYNAAKDDPKFWAEMADLRKTMSAGPRRSISPSG